MIKLKITFLLLIQFVCLSGFQLLAQQQAKMLELDCDRSIQYLLYLPEDYVEGTSKTFPLLMFFHGGGQ